jgi:hypothetical protein
LLETPWSIVLLEKLIVAQRLKKFPLFYETRRFIPCSKETATSSYPEPDECIPQHPIPIFFFFALVLSFLLCVSLQGIKEGVASKKIATSRDNSSSLKS